MLTAANKTQRMAYALTFLELYHKDGDEFLNHIVRVTDDLTWASFVNIENTEQSEQWHIHQTSRKSLNKRCLPARKLMAAIFWDRKGVLTVEFMQKRTTITQEVYSETRKDCVDPFRTKGVEC
jgi:hypothetical protein